MQAFGAATPRVMALVTSLALLAACGAPRSAPSTVSASGVEPTSAASSATFDQALAAGKQEGKVSILTTVGDPRRQFFDDFGQKYGISVEVVQGASQAELVPKVDAERKAGQYLWDVVAHAPAVLFNGFRPLGALDPLRPGLLTPSDLDDAKWQGGFDGGWADKDKAVAYTFVTRATFQVYVNRRFVTEAQMNTIDQLWDPQWKGKIALDDPRVSGGGAQKISALLRAKGEDKVRAFMRDQQPVLTRDRRQMAEWLVRGQYPISVGLSPEFLTSFASQGLDVSGIKPIDDGDPASIELGADAGSLGLFSHAPHPNAAKALATWVLSAEGQALQSKLSGYNSRRTDVATVNPDEAVGSGKNYNHAAADLEESYPLQVRAIALANEVLH
ncbi:MAG TPA: extracellular solute-binding protein [Chloroflexota bacterium]|nr:extracellular solute-binding protein [Chloroflexota bacterium]